MKILGGEKGVLLESGEVYDAAAFGRDVLLNFSEFSELFDEDPELLHVHMGTLAGIVRTSVKTRELDTAARVCEFLGAALENPRAIAEIENAVALSFVEPRELRETATGRSLLESMPEPVRSV